MSFLERTFRLAEKGTTVRTEVLAGLTTFATMAYILFINPDLLSKAGMDRQAVLAATALAAGVGSILMGLMANLPFAMAPGMGMNAYFAFTVVGQMGIPWQTALAAVFLDGVIFMIISVLPLRERMIKEIPYNIKLAAASAIGLFISLIGLRNLGVVVNNPATGQAMGEVLQAPVLLGVVGLLIVTALLHYRVRGALLIGIFVVTVLGFFVPNGPGMVTNAPDFSVPAFKMHAFQLDFTGASHLGLAMIVFTFTFVSLFDTAGTFVGLATRLGWISRESPSFPGAGRGLLAESFAIMFGALMGTSTTTTYIESASGIAEGGRTGLTAVVCGICFVLSLVLAPLALIIPTQATSPILILVGFMMMEPILKLDLEDVTEAIPAYLTLLLVPFTFNVANGLVWGILTYIILKVCTGRTREVGVTMWILGVLCLLSLVGRAHH